VNLLLAELLEAINGSTAAVGVLGFPSVQESVVVPRTVEKLEVLVGVLREQKEAYNLREI